MRELSIDKLDSLLKKIEKLEDIPGGVLRVNVARQIQKVNGYARDNCPTYDGELRNSIHAYSEVTGDGEEVSVIQQKNMPHMLNLVRDLKEKQTIRAFPLQ